MSDELLEMGASKPKKNKPVPKPLPSLPSMPCPIGLVPKLELDDIEDADEVCRKIRAQGGDCVIIEDRKGGPKLDPVFKVCTSPRALG